MMKCSKSVQHGSIVTIKGDKVILAGRKTRNPIGVFMLESKIKGFTLDSSRFEFEIPMGVRTYGEADIRLG